MPLEWGKVEAILFDIDGTLSDSDDQLVMKVEGWLRPFGWLTSAEKRHALARWLVMAAESPGNFIYNQADRLSLDSFLIKLLNQRTRARKHAIKTYWIIPGVEAMLRELAGRYLLGVVSARDEGSSLAFLRQFNLEDCFRVVVTSQTCARTKPFPDPLLHAAQILRTKPQNCLMVGDTTVDMRAASLAGMQALGVLCGFGMQRELLRAGANMIVDSTVDLQELLQEEFTKGR